MHYCRSGKGSAYGYIGEMPKYIPDPKPIPRKGQIKHPKPNIVSLFYLFVYICLIINR
jgi:hypothetical protein